MFMFGLIILNLINSLTNYGLNISLVKTGSFVLDPYIQGYTSEGSLQNPSCLILYVSWMTDPNMYLGVHHVQLWLEGEQ